MGEYEKFLSRREEQCLNALGKWNQNKNVAHQKLITPSGSMSQSTMRTHMTRIFQRYVEGLEVMSEYYDVFHGRFNKHDAKLRKLQRQINKRRREVQ